MRIYAEPDCLCWKREELATDLDDVHEAGKYPACVITFAVLIVHFTRDIVRKVVTGFVVRLLDNYTMS